MYQKGCQKSIYKFCHMLNLVLITYIDYIFYIAKLPELGSTLGLVDWARWLYGSLLWSVSCDHIK